MYRLAGIALIVLGTRGIVHSATFTPLGDLAGGMFRSSAAAVTADGQTVVGSSVGGNDTLEAIRWTAPSGLVRLGDDVPLEYSETAAHGISADGSTIVGVVDGIFPARWTAASGWQMLGDPAATGIAWGASAAGDVIVGTAQHEAFRWTNDAGLQYLGLETSIAYDVSADGSVVVGSPAFYWTSETGVVPLGISGEATAVSADGSIVVGWGESPRGIEAFRWTSAEGLHWLGDLPGGVFESRAYAISDDGRYIVGSSDNGGLGGFIWDLFGGMRSVEDVLSSSGIDMTGWRLTPLDISADGSTIVGQGTYEGRTEAWIATVPEPTGLAGWIVGTIGVLAHVRRCRRSSNSSTHQSRPRARNDAR